MMLALSPEKISHGVAYLVTPAKERASCPPGFCRHTASAEVSLKRQWLQLCVRRFCWRRLQMPNKPLKNDTYKKIGTRLSGPLALNRE